VFDGKYEKLKNTIKSGGGEMGYALNL